MKNKDIGNEQGHWILAKMGKKVLRPGGKELTLKMLANLNIETDDIVVEFAPGLGFTAALALKKNPKTYTGVELNEEAAKLLRKKINGENREIIVSNAEQTTLKNNSCTKVYGEAMLTMQPDRKKTAIVKEAYRILKKGGYYGIHEMGLVPDAMPASKKAEIQKELAGVIKVNARPLTLQEWSQILEKEGFAIIRTETNPMFLLQTKRMIKDEGLLRTIKIVFNLFTHPKALKRILAMRQVFTRYKEHLNAVSLVAKK